MGWGYYALHTFVNNIKKMFRSTVLVILLCIFAFGAVFGLVGAAIGHFAGTESTEISSEAADETDREEDMGEDDEMTPEDIEVLKTCAEAGIAVLFLAMLLIGIYSGSKNGADIFLMADVNFLFTAPVRPQSVLMFRLSFQMIMSVFGSVYLVFQIPNLVMNVGLDALGVAAVFTGWIMLVVYQKLMTVFSYTVFTTHDRLKKYVVPAIWAFIAVLLLVLAALFVVSDKNPYRLVQMTFGSQWMRYVPVIGWLKGMVMSAVNGQMIPFAIYLLLLVVFVFILVFFIWHLKADFYEDALSKAGKTAELLNAVQEGRMVKKEHSKRVRREGNLTGRGAEMFFTKEIYSRRRLVKFGFLTNTMLFYLAVTLCLAFFMMRILEQGSFFFVGVLLLLVMFFRNMGNPIEQETSNNWLFLVPDNPYKKVFFAMMAGTYSCAADLFPGLLLSALLLKEKILVFLLWYVTLVVSDFMLSAVGLVLEACFPSSALQTVKAAIQMFLRLFLLLFLVLPMVGGYFFGGQIAALVLTDVVATVFGGVAFLIYPALLHGGRK